MKRPQQLSLAIALALGASNALALGLGAVQVKSRLNQPFEAEIPVIQGSAGEAEGLLVSLASAEDFDRVGVSRSRLTVPLQFALVKGANGQTVIKVTSKDPVRDSYLDFLIEANWPNGRMLREYTVLLDPPLTAPAHSVATTTAPSARTRPLHETPATSASSQPKPAAAPRATGAPAAPAMARVSDGQYGPVQSGETLSAIARTARPDGSTNLNQMMLALLKSNPGAFYKDNVNALKRGAILRIPSAEEIRATGSAREAAAQIQSQIEDWRGGSASPTRIAETASRESAPPPETKAAKSTSSPAATASAGERIELVPPKVGKGSVAMADSPGSGAGNPTTTRELKADLARAKESLATRDQETGELKSRLDELEDLKDKNDRLLSLKNSEIADLQQKLKELREAPAAGAKPVTVAPVAAPVVATPAEASSVNENTAKATKSPPDSTTASPAINKKDIWGEAGEGGAKPSDTSAKPAATTPDATKQVVQAPAPMSSGARGENAVTEESATTVVAPPATPPVSSNSAATAASTASSMPAKPVAKPTPPAVRPAAPWYDAAWVKPAALGAGVLLVLLGLLGLRKRKSDAPAARGSIAGEFGDSPLSPSDDVDGSVAAEAASLREQLLDDPANVGLHLELLSVYYAERDIESFEEAAREMHEHVSDPYQPEWLEAQAMGQELAPHNPLFAGAGAYDDGEDETEYATTEELPVVYVDDMDAEDDAFDDASIPDPLVSGGPEVSSTMTDDGTGYTFDDLPPLEPSFGHDAEAVPAVPEPPPLDDDYFPGEDATGTKLDLAKAYMDMGDPEGARSMLDEVIAEGSEVQRAEAHRLIADLG